ncbi:T9SS type A sorting domain-containing protein [Flavobacterium sp. RHBU_24]|uniref:T9SS type A sorting domain-containing protein n=1 Tax=Flavobacterium sp. RHBU_24 TaxID=3391185 RepID=UPI003984A1B4
MKKFYFYTTLTLLFLFSLGAVAQENRVTPAGGNEPIEGLNIYPNPVSGGKIYITSKSGLNKDVEIYDVLGKRILQATVTSKELSVSELTSGVYIIKIKEGDATATKKLIIK